ncbi:MAG: prepilin-type N-terminal cleavage/methylation domain-containing protein [Candidatus Kerfeldbacteria bacterium]|nr:prepilin-type N-terminal cleavage/methylation domain-containing protein [Candidatus Kerfeldbacteria bacterium]
MIAKPNSRGFTLLELLIVMFIIGVLTMIIVVNFNRGDKTQDLRSTSTQLIQSIRLAQGYSTGGNSLFFCGLGATQHAYERCANDAYCGGAVNSCTDAVPPGGYGVHFGAPYSYTLFGNTNTAENYFSVVDPLIFQADTLPTHVGMIAYRIGGVTHAAEVDSLDIVFIPPTGTISFFVGALPDASTQVDLLMKHQEIDTICRIISVNRASNQISESQGGCTF